MGEQTIHDIDNLTWGICEVYWNGEALGATKGNVNANIVTKNVPVYSDKYGSVPTKQFDVGTTISVEVPLAETERLESLLAAFPVANRNGRSLEFGEALDETDLTTGGLVLKATQGDLPYLVIYKALVTDEPVQIGYTNDGLRVLQITFESLLDSTRDEGEMTFHIGETAGYFGPTYMESGYF